MSDIYFKEGIDPKFFNFLVNLYKPFLSSAYSNADIKYTVYSKQYKHPIGIVALKKTKSGGNFFEIALIPSMRGSGYGREVVKEFLKIHPFSKINWTAHKANLPSIKLLKSLNGGFYEKTVKNKKRVEAEGFFRPNGTVSKKMRSSLDELIPESEEKFDKWLKDFNLVPGRTSIL
jgi:hypothetical protein